jgi:sister chromatid cohesion protein DCC1
MAEYILSFSPSSCKDQGRFKLLELAPELCDLIQTEIDKPSRSVLSCRTVVVLTPGGSLVIKGHASEDAVLCTSNRTYSLRSVALSNSVLVVTHHPSKNTIHTLAIRDQLTEIMELIPAVPKLHKLGILLKGLEYGEEQEDDHLDQGNGGPVSSLSPSKSRVQR